MPRESNLNLIKQGKVKARKEFGLFELWNIKRLPPLQKGSEETPSRRDADFEEGLPESDEEDGGLGRRIS